MQVLYGYYYLYHSANNYKGPDEAMSYMVDKSDITGTFYKNGLFIDELIQKFELYHNRFYMYSVTGNSFAWDADEHLWSANDTPIVIPEGQSISVEFNFPLLFPNEFTTCFLGQMVESSDIAPSDDFVYDQGYNSGYNVGYIEGVAITNDANANPGDILSGKSAYVQGKKVYGNIPIIYQSNITLNTQQHQNALGALEHEIIFKTKSYTTPNQAIHCGATYLRDIEPNFMSYNIRKGVSMLGINGAFDNFDTGRKMAAPFYFQNQSTPSYTDLYDAQIFSDVYQEPYTGKYLSCDVEDFLEMRTAGSPSSDIFLLVRNKTDCATIKVRVHTEVVDDSDYYESWDDIISLDPNEEAEIIHGASNESSPSYDWSYYITHAHFSMD